MEIGHAYCSADRFNREKFDVYEDALIRIYLATQEENQEICKIASAALGGPHFPMPEDK